ncbi:phospholipase D-like domain-containing protein [Sagittula sp. S175]|uniref:phospholipase D-like domain-containing protein n=1 Tax=Sagittula sp. S175 TaxID=3415129 RepID=UPI003C7ACF4F
MTPAPQLKALLTRDDTLAALETLAADAQSELILAFRSFAPDTPLQTERLRELGLSTWTDLIPWLTRRGVRLFVAFGDDDPLLDSARHRRAWLTASGFANVAQGDAQILCAPHGQQAGAVWRWRLRGPLRRALKRLRQDEPRHLTMPQRATLKGTHPLRSQHINQSFAIADGERALIGGFSLDARRSDTAWHDVAALIEDADFAGALRAHFADSWAAAIATKAPPLATPARPFHSVTRRQSRPELRLLRTLSDPRTDPFRLTAQPRDTSFATQLARHFAAARDSVYIETTAFRDAALTEALTRAATSAPDLNVVLILDPRADRLPLAGAAGGVNHARALQDAQLSRLCRAFGSRLTILTQALGQAPATGPDPLPGRLAVIDRTFAILGSHVLTRRALALDTEASVLVRNPSFAADLLDRRAQHWLGQTPDSFSASAWRQAKAPLEAVTPPSARPLRHRLPDILF